MNARGLPSAGTVLAAGPRAGGSVSQEALVALKLRVKGIAATAAFGGFILMAAPASAVAAQGGPGPVPGPATDISQSCSGQNAEVEQAVDPARGYVYEDWMGCGGIGFARSADGGQHFSAPITVPGSAGGTWDPAVAVAPNGTVYAAYIEPGWGPAGPRV